MRNRKPGLMGAISMEPAWMRPKIVVEGYLTREESEFEGLGAPEPG